MYRIKRTKGGQVHYATSLGAEGNMTGLSANKADAFQVEEDVALKVEAFYENRPLAGDIEAESIDAKELKAIAKEKERSAIAALETKHQAQIAALETEIAELRAKVPPPAFDPTPDAAQQAPAAEEAGAQDTVN